MAGHALDAGVHMERIYRYQRHIYDVTRRYFLLARDRMIEGLAVPEGGAVLEVGCGTGRNLIRAARRYPHAMCFGFDISPSMLETARASVRRSGLESRLALAQADATDFNARELFGRATFDRVFISYALSMIPPWQDVIEGSVQCLAPGGELHVVDFGQQEGLPRPFRSILFAWLAKFDVTPRGDLEAVLISVAERNGLEVIFSRPFRGYAYYAVLRKRMA